VQIWLSGEPPFIVDGRTFDPHAQLLRTFANRRRRYGLIQPTVEEGRKRYRRDTRNFRGPVTRVGAVRDLEIPGPAGPLRARHYAPLSRDRRDLVVYLHGGGFTMGDLETHDEPCRILCRHADGHVLSIDYRLAPENPFPAGLEDARAALAWAQANAASLGADAKRVAIAGDSAGANLATVAARMAVGERMPPLAQLLIYPVVDFAGTYRSRELFGDGYSLRTSDRADFGLCYLTGTGVRPADPRVSPLRDTNLSGAPPAVVITAGFDLLRDEGEAYAAALVDAGNRGSARRMPSLPHGFIHMTGVCPAAREAMRTIAEDWRTLIDRQIAGPGS
jgi:acetyl esterase